MQRLCATIDRATAQARLERQNRGRLATFLLGTARVSTTSRLDLVSLPHYLVTFTSSDAQRSFALTVLVGAHEPTVELHDLSGVTWELVAVQDQFAPSIGSADAEELARRRALAFCASRRRWRSAALRLELTSCELIAYPYWANYFHRRAGLFDVRLLDAVSGRPAGARIKVALLTALAARRDALAGATRTPLETVDTAT